MFEKWLIEAVYRRASSPEELIWHCDQPPELLARAVEERGRPGRALDLGCGGGGHAIYLAGRGYDVTGIDRVPKAIEMAATAGRQAGVRIRWVQADLLDLRADHRFDLVLDAGTLHNIRARDLGAYRRRLLSWIAPGGDFVLVHFGKRHFLDWRPVGPRRRSRERLVRLFSPELMEQAYRSELRIGVPPPIGPSLLAQSFWFRAAS